MYIKNLDELPYALYFPRWGVSSIFLLALELRLLLIWTVILSVSGNVHHSHMNSNGTVVCFCLTEEM